MSRIYGGFHFQFANRDGSASGRAVGDFVAENFLLPVARLPLLRLEGFTDGHPVLRVHGEIGKTYALESTVDFMEWTRLKTARGQTGGVLMQDILTASAMGRFYRLVQVGTPDLESRPIRSALNLAIGHGAPLLRTKRQIRLDASLRLYLEPSSLLHRSQFRV
jgi:hypothetical protein